MSSTIQRLRKEKFMRYFTMGPSYLPVQQAGILSKGKDLKFSLFVFIFCPASFPFGEGWDETLIFLYVSRIDNSDEGYYKLHQVLLHTHYHDQQMQSSLLFFEQLF